ncbi:MAG: hypothetical protein JWO70_4167 [Betaproteobacteria bacterium]|nr:hypothetical protein [Betaproteobacteria bacterium]
MNAMKLSRSSATRIGLWTILLSVFGCAAPLELSETATQTGVVQERYIVPTGNSYWNRDFAGTMGGFLGLAVVDTLYNVPQHFRYMINLADSSTVYVWNKADIGVGTCVRLWLKPWRGREGDYPLDYNRLELSNDCTVGSVTP